MRFSRPLLFAAAIAAGLMLIACAGTSEAKPNGEIFVGPPWTGPETLTYQLDQQGVDNEAVCVLKTEPGPAGQTTLQRLCSDNRGYKDEGVAVVESETLQPVESKRTTFDVRSGTTTVHSVDYSDAQATFATTSGDKTRDTTRDLPTPTAAVPNPAWYDDESLLWLVRGVKLEDGYKASYTHVINAGQPRVLNVDLQVEATERVEVPAGSFTAWKIRVTRESSRYTFWVDTGASHRMVKASIEESTYQLRAAE